MTEHSSTLWLPAALRANGINVIELDGWTEAQGLYFWTTPGEGTIGDWDGDPSCYMIHHTAGSSATPVVRTPTGRWSKANCWAGLLRGDRLYQDGDGVPTVVFTSAGPARTSSGYGYWPTALEVFDDVRVPWRQENPDGPLALNRYAWNVETVCRGDGSELDPGVEHALIVMGALLCDHYGWSPWRTIGHVTWTTRKIDPTWNWESDRIVAIQDAVAELMEDDMTDVYVEMTAGWVRGLDEDHDKTRQEFTRLNTEQQSDGGYILEPANSPATVEYFMDHLDDPYWSEWPGFRARTELSVWGR